ncbi:MAG: DUF4249 domain-containing protein [Gemmatimonadota bacterium]
MRSISSVTMRRWAGLAVLLALLIGCERVVQVTAPRTEPRLVVEARLERQVGRRAPIQRIRLTTTQDVFSSDSAPPARGAVVRVLDAAGSATVFAESPSEPGVYVATTLMLLPVGQTFTLQITWDGDEYLSRETMLRAVPIDSVYFTEGGGLPGIADGLRGTISFTDPGDRQNYYLWDQWVDGVRQLSPDSGSFSRAVLPDDIINGNMVRDFQPYRGVVVRTGQVVRIRQSSISDQAYRFYEALSEQTNNNGSPFGVPASSIRGNVANLTRPARLALGYFIATEYSEQLRQVP